MQRATPDDLAELTPAQREAVLHTEGPLLVVASAGSGKTRVITRRVAHLVRGGVDPRHILAITFTNKAAGEMQHRIARLSGGAKVAVHTFHALCARLLRRHAARVGLRNDFSILDDSDQQAAVREALVETGTDPKLYGPAKVLHAIEREKDQLRGPKECLEAAITPYEKAVAAAYGVYQETLRQSNAVDFGELLVLAVRLLEDPEAHTAIAGRFRYLLIDEYQDTNHAQYVLAKLLAREHRNVCATGDPNQAIYGWRGADIRNILRFEEDYPDAKVVLLEDNFRSTRTILRAANGLISHNKERKETTLRTPNGAEGDPIELRVLHDEKEEGRFVARRVQERLLQGVRANEIACFYRAGALSRSVELGLLERGIPFEVVGAVAFYQRKEVKDLLAYLRLVVNPRDDLALQRVVNVPPRGVGKGTLARVKEKAAERGGCSLIEAADALVRADEVRGKGREGLKAFVQSIGRLSTWAASEPSVEEVLRTLVAETGYREYLVREFPDDEQDRLMNLEGLIGAAREFDVQANASVAAGRPALPTPMPKGASSVAPPRADEEDDGGPLFAGFAPPPGPAREETPEPAPLPDPLDPLGSDAPLRGVSGFLEHVALVTTFEEQKTDEPRVQLMTVHAAKGLEFDTVFVTGLEDGLFPHSRALEEGRGLEEERRLAYVAITRARRVLVLTRASWRMRQGYTQPQRPSMFLVELPPEVFPAGAGPRDIERAFQRAEADAEEAGATPSWKRGLVRQDEDGVDPPAPDDADWVEDELPPPSHRRTPAPVRPAMALHKPAPTSGVRPGPLGIRVPAAARPAPAPEATAFKEGDRVLHEHFGPGRILGVAGKGVGLRVRVRFAQHGEKELVLQYARMTKLEG